MQVNLEQQDNGQWKFDRLNRIYRQQRLVPTGWIIWMTAVAVAISLLDTLPIRPAIIIIEAGCTGQSAEPSTDPDNNSCHQSPERSLGYHNRLWDLQGRNGAQEPAST